jgi:Zinc carboxypeptidase
VIGSFCVDIERGVNLRNNYNFNFALDDIGSSGDPCDQHYRGKTAFSERETNIFNAFI